MAKKQLAFEAEAREAIKEGVVKLARAVKSTLGPRGRNAILDKGWGGPTVTKDGVTVAEEIELADKYENMGAQMVKEAASKTSDVAGDGTTTATVLAEAFFLNGIKNVTAGADPMSLNRGMRKAVDKLIEELKKMSTPVKGKEEISAIATIAANGEVQIGKMIAEAMEKVGKDGVITVEEGKGLETTVDVVEGMQFDRGYLSPHFITDPDSMTVDLRDAFILVYEEKISSAKGLIPLMEKVSKAKKPILIIAEDVEGEALATLVVNKLRGIISCAAVKAPGYGDRRKAMLQDLSILTNAKPIFKDIGVDLENVSLQDLGRAKHITIDNDNTTIVEGAGASAGIKGRIEQIRKEIEITTSDYDREKLQERLAKLAGGVAQINVGAAAETEMKEKKARVEDALHATRAAIEEGVVPGGGVTLIRLSSSLDGLKLDGDEATGVAIVRDALSMPLKCIAENAGIEGAVVVKKVAGGSGAFGYDADKEEYCDLMKAGIIDPAKVTRCALLNGLSVATVLLTTDVLIADIPSKAMPPAGGPGGPGMGGMGGMDDMGMM